MNNYVKLFRHANLIVKKKKQILQNAKQRAKRQREDLEEKEEKKEGKKEEMVEKEKRKEEKEENRIDAECFTVGTSVEERGNEKVFTTTIYLPNCCAYCTERLQETVPNDALEEFNGLEDRVGEMTKLHLICDETFHANMANKGAVFAQIKENSEFLQRFRRYCEPCFRQAILAHIEKPGAFMQLSDRDGLTTFQLSCPICWPNPKTPLDTDRLLSFLDF